MVAGRERISRGRLGSSVVQPARAERLGWARAVQVGWDKGD